MNSELAAWLVRRTSAKRVKDIEVIDGNSAPCWEHEAGFTHWKNGRPKKYTRSVSAVHVGADWLAKAFPAAWARMRLLGDGCLSVRPGELLDFDQSERLRLTSARYSAAACWQDIVRRKETNRTTDPETERHYA